MRQSWELLLYHSLINCSQYLLNDGTTMALHLYWDMAAQGQGITGKTFELLLGLAHKREHLNSYLTVSNYLHESLTALHWKCILTLAKKKQKNSCFGVDMGGYATNIYTQDDYYNIVHELRHKLCNLSRCFMWLTMNTIIKAHPSTCTLSLPNTYT